ncbi:VOC family protein [Taklimakanibacter deserti]|uniref:VOC family protein n=1 Tax=Taklimakanibacter deserti TaxID=2267839 RepID=UPI000E64B71B
MSDPRQSSGIHHVTLVTANAQRNVDFYAGFLGLRLVKRTAGFEDSTQLHLFYGDQLGSPGSLITALVWQEGARGRQGLGQAFEIALAIPAEAMGFWLTRAMTLGLKTGLPGREFGEPVLRLSDPDGVIIKLVGQDELLAPALFHPSDIPAAMAVRRIRGVTWLSNDPNGTRAALPQRYGYRESAREGAATRFISLSGDVVDLREASGFWPGAPGPGTIDHVAFRASGHAELDALHAAFAAEARATSPIKDRRYFTSLYVREPGGILTEFATDEPGMTVDEDEAGLGTKVFVPPHEAAREKDIIAMLPDISAPGEPRDPAADLPFIHRLKRAEKSDGATLILFHGTGGHEADLLPLGREIAPQADLLGFRGRSSEEGSLRWFRRYGMDRFDQADIARETGAFAATLPQALSRYGLDPSRVTALGYSNGANFVAALMLLHPGLLARAILLRPMLVLETPPTPDLSDTGILTIAGRSDPYGQYAPPLVDHFRRCGSRITAETIAAGHGLDRQDIVLTRRWYEANVTAPPGSD